MDCTPELVTGFVDRALVGPLRLRVGNHLVQPCPFCEAQAAEERRLRQRLRSLTDPEPAPGLEPRVRLRLVQAGRSTRLLALAAAFGLLAALVTPASLRL